MECGFYRSLIFQMLTQDVYMLLADTVSPEPFLEIHGIHIDNSFKTDRNRRFPFFSLFLFGLVTIYAEQRTGTKHIISSVQTEILQRRTSYRTILYLVEHKTCTMRLY